MGRALSPTSTIAVIAALLGTTPGDRAKAQRSGTAMALVGVNVVDVRLGHILPNQTVLVVGDTIAAVQDAAIPLNPSTKVVPGAGKYVLPGLWDMHVHITDAKYLDAFVVHGVTGVRDMGGGLEKPANGCESVSAAILRQWRSEIAAGRRTGPEIVFSGPPVSGTGWPTSLPARSPSEARAAVRTLKRSGVDFIKVYEGIPLAAYRAMASAAKRNQLQFAGHVPDAVGPLAAIRAGQRSIEHLRDPLLVCFTSDRAELERFFTRDGWSAKDRSWGRTASADCPKIFQALRDNQAWVTPTLTVEKAKINVEDQAFVRDARRDTLPTSVRSGFATYVSGKLGQSASDRASEHLWWRTQQMLVKRMRKEGVRLLAGTDSACQGGLPGPSLHGELAELVKAGLTPAEALRTATLEPARYFGRKTEGEIRAGNRANLVLLDANPIENIANSKRIHAVVINGKLLGRQDLVRLARHRS